MHRLHGERVDVGLAFRLSALCTEVSGWIRNQRAKIRAKIWAKIWANMTQPSWTIRRDRYDQI
jgi:hypothetical protein